IRSSYVPGPLQNPPLYTIDLVSSISEGNATNVRSDRKKIQKRMGYVISVKLQATDLKIHT
ncbi:hypothetical protein, partial [Exiguobacterium sp.]|uniref:hypothetical protein n=1 Tax=Exiguobacterium sp. TaxID=44751 RepID=UPI0028A1ED4A